MADTTSEPAFSGTPDQWWEQADEITEAEAADRVLGDWYIARETSSYRVSTSTYETNEARKGKLRRDVARRRVDPGDISPKVRKLIHVKIEQPAWIAAELIMADRNVGSADREPWRRSRTGRWHLLSDARLSISERDMAGLNPRVAVILEQIEQ